MLSFDDALRRVLEAAPLLDPETVLITEADGRVLAEALCAKDALPATDYSAMDGYALSTADLPRIAPWTLPVHGESRAGHGVEGLVRGTVCRIFTGAPIPSGADSVIIQEDVVLDEKTETIRCSVRPARGNHIRRRGEDLREGTVALEAGTRLSPYALGLAAAVDCDRVTVSRRPRVSLLCTGDELRMPGTPKRPFSLPESNSVVIAALARGAGADVHVSPPLADDVATVTEHIEKALSESDLVITLGGASVGAYDVVRPALERAGVRVAFFKVAMRPGKPLTFGERKEKRVLGLPGNPVSAQATFALFGLPLIRAMQGEHRLPERSLLRLTHSVKQKPGRRGFYRATTRGGDVTPLGAQSSGSVVEMARADAFVVLSEDAPGAAAGELVSVLRFSEL